MSRYFKSTGMAELREIGDVILLPKNGKIKNMEKKVLVLNDVAAYIWKQLDRGVSEDSLVGLMLRKHEVDRPTLVADVKYFIDTVEYIGLIEPKKPTEKEIKLAEEAPAQKVPYHTPKIYVYNLETDEEVAYGPHIRGRSFTHRAIMRAYHGGCC